MNARSILVRSPKLDIFSLFTLFYLYFLEKINILKNHTHFTHLIKGIVLGQALWVC